jgi:RNA polymerase sigma-70 factor (ECF subfamily)
MPDAPEPTDEELVRRVRDGDEAAARLLFERHLPALRARARARLPQAIRGKVAASDVVQDAWLAAFLSLGDFEDRGDGSFGAWLRRILERKILDEARMHVDAEKRDARREARLGTGAAARLAAEDQLTPSAEVVAAEDEAALLAAIEELSDEHRAVVWLVDREGLTFVDAGARLGRTPDAARMLYGRALTRLSELLERRGQRR